MDMKLPERKKSPIKSTTVSPRRGLPPGPADSRLLKDSPLLSPRYSGLPPSTASPFNGDIQTVASENNRLYQLVDQLTNENHSLQERMAEIEHKHQLFETERSSMQSRAESAERELERERGNFDRALTRERREHELQAREHVMSVLEESTAKITAVERQEALRWQEQVERSNRQLADKTDRINQLELQLLRENEKQAYISDDSARKVMRAHHELEKVMGDLDMQLQRERELRIKAENSLSAQLYATQMEYATKLKSVEEALKYEHDLRQAGEFEHVERLEKLATERDAAERAAKGAESQLDKLMNEKARTLDQAEDAVKNLTDLIQQERSRRIQAEDRAQDALDHLEEIHRGKMIAETEVERLREKIIKLLEGRHIDVDTLMNMQGTTWQPVVAESSAQHGVQPYTTSLLSTPDTMIVTGGPQPTTSSVVPLIATNNQGRASPLQQDYGDSGARSRAKQLMEFIHQELQQNEMVTTAPSLPEAGRVTTTPPLVTEDFNREIYHGGDTAVLPSPKELLHPQDTSVLSAFKQFRVSPTHTRVVTNGGEGGARSSPVPAVPSNPSGVPGSSTSSSSSGSGGSSASTNTLTQLSPLAMSYLNNEKPFFTLRSLQGNLQHQLQSPHRHLEEAEGETKTNNSGTPASRASPLLQDTHTTGTTAFSPTKPTAERHAEAPTALTGRISPTGATHPSHFFETGSPVARPPQGYTGRATSGSIGIVNANHERAHPHSSIVELVQRAASTSRSPRTDNLISRGAGEGAGGGRTKLINLIGGRSTAPSSLVPTTTLRGNVSPARNSHLPQYFTTAPNVNLYTAGVTLLPSNLPPPTSPTARYSSPLLLSNTSSRQQATTAPHSPNKGYTLHSLLHKNSANGSNGTIPTTTTTTSTDVTTTVTTDVTSKTHSLPSPPHNSVAVTPTATDVPTPSSGVSTELGNSPLSRTLAKFDFISSQSPTLRAQSPTTRGTDQTDLLSLPSNSARPLSPSLALTGSNNVGSPTSVTANTATASPSTPRDDTPTKTIGDTRPHDNTTTQQQQHPAKTTPATVTSESKATEEVPSISRVENENSITSIQGPSPPARGSTVGRITPTTSGRGYGIPTGMSSIGTAPTSTNSSSTTTTTTSVTTTNSLLQRRADSPTHFPHKPNISLASSPRSLLNKASIVSNTSMDSPLTQGDINKVDFGSFHQSINTGYEVESPTTAKFLGPSSPLSPEPEQNPRDFLSPSSMRVKEIGGEKLIATAVPRRVGKPSPLSEFEPGASPKTQIISITAPTPSHGASGNVEPVADRFYLSP